MGFKNKAWQLPEVFFYTSYLKVILEHFNKFCMRQGIKAHLTFSEMVVEAELLKSFQGKTGAKKAYLIDICQFTIIDLWTHMKVYSMNHLDYSNLKVFKDFLFAQIKLIQLNSKVAKCAFNGYLEGRNELQAMGSGIWGIKVHHKQMY